MSLPLSQEQLCQYLEKTFPHFLSQEISDFTYIDEGWETEIFSFTFTYLYQSNVITEYLVIRIYTGKDKISKAINEQKVLSSLFTINYPVPQIFHFDCSIQKIPHPFIILEQLRGGSMGKRYFISSKEEQINLMKDFCFLFSQLHCIDWTKIPIEVPEQLVSSPYYYIEEKLEKYGKIIKEHKFQEFVPFLEWLKLEMTAVPLDKLALTHQDFHPHNILYDIHTKPYVIDWTASSITDYRIDLGWTLLLTESFTSREFRDLILDFYETTRGTKVQNIDYFEILAIFRRTLDIITVYKIGSEVSGLRSNILSKLKKEINHIITIRELLKERTGLELPTLDEIIATFT